MIIYSSFKALTLCIVLKIRMIPVFHLSITINILAMSPPTQVKHTMMQVILPRIAWILLAASIVLSSMPYSSWDALKLEYMVPARTMMPSIEWTHMLAFQ